MSPDRLALIVLRAPGTNCDEETAAAWELRGRAAPRPGTSAA